MKQLFPLLLVLLLSCSENKPHVQQQQHVPQALVEQNSDVRLFSKRYGNDLVQELYNELLKNNSSLNAFENEVELIPEQKADSLDYYQTFTAKNNEYYSSAEHYITLIKDSVLKNRIKNLLAESKTKLEMSLTQHRNLVTEVEAKDNHLEDLHNAVKLMVTLPVMEKFQQENKPLTDPIKAISKKYDVLITKADSLLKK
jgi:hypothetical protein